MRLIRTLERKWIPNFRRNKFYKMFKTLLYMLLVYPLIGVSKLMQLLLVRIKLKRKNKPDIVFADIVEGWTNLIIEDAVVEEIAEKRAKICAQCPFAEYEKGIQALVIDNRMSYVRGLKCGQCGCPLSTKIRSKGTYCPIGKW